MIEKRSQALLVAGAAYVVANLAGLLYCPPIGFALIVLSAREMVNGRRYRAGTPDDVVS
jgi:hypothetical protein